MDLVTVVAPGSVIILGSDFDLPHLKGWRPRAKAYLGMKSTWRGVGTGFPVRSHMNCTPAVALTMPWAGRPSVARVQFPGARHERLRSWSLAGFDSLMAMALPGVRWQEPRARLVTVERGAVLPMSSRFIKAR